MVNDNQNEHPITPEQAELEQHVRAMMGRSPIEPNKPERENIQAVNPSAIPSVPALGAIIRPTIQSEQLTSNAQTVPPENTQDETASNTTNAQGGRIKRLVKACLGNPKIRKICLAVLALIFLVLLLIVLSR